MMSWFFVHVGAACPGGSFLFFPAWYKYLPAKGSVDSNGLCTPQITGLNDIWLVAAAVLEILLRIATLAAIGFIIYGSFEYITSQGEPDKTSKARSTIQNAAIGLAIAITSTAMINFIAGRVS